MTDFRNFIPALPYRDTPRMPDGIVRYGDAAMTEYALSAAKAAYAAAIEDAVRICKGYAAEHPDLGYGAGDCAAAIRALDPAKEETK